MADVTLTPDQREILAEEIDQLIYGRTDAHARAAYKAVQELGAEFRVLAQLGWFSEDAADRSHTVSAADVRAVVPTLIAIFDEHMAYTAEEVRKVESGESDGGFTSAEYRDRDRWLAQEREGFERDERLRAELVRMLDAAAPQLETVDA